MSETHTDADVSFEQCPNCDRGFEKAIRRVETKQHSRYIETLDEYANTLVIHKESRHASPKLGLVKYPTDTCVVVEEDVTYDDLDVPE